MVANRSLILWVVGWSSTYCVFASKTFFKKRGSTSSTLLEVVRPIYAFPGSHRTAISWGVTSNGVRLNTARLSEKPRGHGHEGKDRPTERCNGRKE